MSNILHHGDSRNFLILFGEFGDSLLGKSKENLEHEMEFGELFCTDRCRGPGGGEHCHGIMAP